jgi:hypothetical protein
MNIKDALKKQEKMYKKMARIEQIKSLIPVIITCSFFGIFILGMWIGDILK